MEEEIKRRSPPEYIRGQFSPYCYDAVWTLAYALNDTLQGLLDQYNMNNKQLQDVTVLVSL